MTTHVFHEGELTVQARAGVSAIAQKVGRIITPQLPEGADGFLANLPILFRGGTDSEGHVWASALTGHPGFIRATAPQSVEINAHPQPRDPLAQQPDNAPAGFLAIDLATRQRFRFNGTTTKTDSSLRVHVEQAYGNCPKYIQLREVVAYEPTPSTEVGDPVVGANLSDEDADLIRLADTFFIASTADGHGADVSHRGGPPGFVRVNGDNTLSFDDYPGNNMFQTLGNLTADPRAGLLFIDFTTGTTLQLTGRATIDWMPPHPDDRFHTGRAVTFTPTRVVRIPHALPLRWVLRSYSPFNPEEKNR
jgi:predicted pyridoxine 5'-phosphate oxidase superfamily flavin-nucleotide-binding protein